MASGSYNFGPPPPPPTNGPGGYSSHGGHNYPRSQPRHSMSGVRSRERGLYSAGQFPHAAVEYNQPYGSASDSLPGGHMTSSRHAGGNGNHSAHGYIPHWTHEPTYSSAPAVSHNTAYAPAPRQVYGHQSQYSQPPYRAVPHPQPYHHYQDLDQSQWNGHQASYVPARSRGVYHVERGGPESYDVPLPAPVSNSYGPSYAEYPDHRAYGPVAVYQAYAPQSLSHQSPHLVGHPPYHRDGSHNHFNRRGRGGIRDSTTSRSKSDAHGEKSRPRKIAQLSLEEGIPNRQEQAFSSKKKKRKTNTLGLIPDIESESEDDDEEDTLVQLLDGQGIQVFDMTSYLAERKAKYPTKERIEARKLMATEQVPKKQEKTLLEKQADSLRRQLRKVEKTIKRKREQGDEGDDMRDSSPEDEASDDEKPEVLSSRPSDAASNKKADISSHCKYFSTGGTCGKKGKCRFVHDTEVRSAALQERDDNGGHLTISQRLALNDKNQEDLSILESIQYLRELGIAEPHRLLHEKEPELVPGPSNAPPRLLPVGPATLPPLPIRRETGLPIHQAPPSLVPNAGASTDQHYQGWVLRPYGNGNEALKQPEVDILL